MSRATGRRRARMQAMLANQRQPPRVHFVGLSEEDKVDAQADELQYLREENTRLHQDRTARAAKLAELYEEIAQLKAGVYKEQLYKDMVRTNQDLRERLGLILSDHARVMHMLGDFMVEAGDFNLMLEHHSIAEGKDEDGYPLKICEMATWTKPMPLLTLVRQALNHDCDRAERVLP